MTAAISPGFTPLSSARLKCPVICWVWPPAISAATVTRLRSRGASSVRFQTSPNSTSSV